jgi:hypothetical protein
LNDVSKKKQILTYKQDTDIPNVTYFNKFNEIYGQVEYTYASEFVKDIDKKELVFSPTPIANMINGAIVPMLLGPAPKTNIRILYDGGPYTCGNYSIINYQGNTITNNTFPYLSHFDKPFNPTFDINFATCDDYYDKTLIGKTNNNLFNLHWRRTINQIDTGKMLSASFILRENDIRDLKLNSKVKVGNSWFQINKIIDYDANTTKPTKVELITADDGIKIPFISKPLPVSINNNSKFEIENGMMKKRTYQTNLIGSSGDFQINGINNVIDSGFKSGIIDGNYNRIDGNALVFGDGNLVQDTNFVMGSNNTIIPGVGNSIVIGDGVTALTSNTLYANNIVIPTGGTLNGVAIESGTTISLTDTYVTGGTYSSGTTVFTNNTGGTFSVSGFSTGSTQYFTGGTGSNSIVSTQSGSFPNIASGDYSFVVGQINTASGDYSFPLGIGNTASDEATIALGAGNTASGGYAYAQGDSNTSSGRYSYSQGRENNAVGDYSYAQGRNAYAVAPGEWCRSTGNGTSGGTGSFPAQYGIYDLSLTTNSSPIQEIFIGEIPNARIYIPPGTYMRYDFTAIAVKPSTGVVKEWAGRGLIKNVGGTTSMVGSTNVSTYADAGFNPSLGVAADNVNDSLYFEAVGIAVTEIKWYIKVEYIYIQY